MKRILLASLVALPLIAQPLKVQGMDEVPVVETIALTRVDTVPAHEDEGVDYVEKKVNLGEFTLEPSGLPADIYDEYDVDSSEVGTARIAFKFEENSVAKPLSDGYYSKLIDALALALEGILRFSDGSAGYPSYSAILIVCPGQGANAKLSALLDARNYPCVFENEEFGEKGFLFTLPTVEE